MPNNVGTANNCYYLTDISILFLKVVEKNSENQKENKDDPEYGIQYFNKF